MRQAIAHTSLETEDRQQRLEPKLLEPKWLRNMWKICRPFGSACRSFLPFSFSSNLSESEQPPNPKGGGSPPPFSSSLGQARSFSFAPGGSGGKPFFGSDFAPQNGAISGSILEAFPGPVREHVVFVKIARRLCGSHVFEAPGSQNP